MNVAIVGNGNVGSHLRRLLGPVACTAAVDPRTLAGLPSEADVCLVAVNDAAAVEVCRRLDASPLPEGCIIAHTAGSVPMPALESHPSGVFYPLQTFSKEAEMDYPSIPWLIEGTSEEAEERLTRLAEATGARAIPAGSELRSRIHLAAVVACNLANHLWTLSDGLLRRDGLDLGLLGPLLRQTLDKALAIGPEKAQTGPAARGDREVITRQLRSLQEEPRLREIYECITNSILNYKSGRKES